MAFTPWLGGLFLALLVMAAGTGRGWKGRPLTGRFRRQHQMDLTTRIERLLPQTQCGQCGFPGCAPYAQAIAAGTAINKCPPGGERTIRLLAELLQQPIIELDPAHGVSKPPRVAQIHETQCIGCTKCIQACPVDAILGAPKLMHTVIASECTGCELCVAPCPVDCIDMLDVPLGFQPGEAARSELTAPVAMVCGT